MVPTASLVNPSMSIPPANTPPCVAHRSPYNGVDGAPHFAAVRAALEAVALRDAAVQAWAFVADASALEAYPVCAGPLTGLPIGVKDVIDVEGMPTRCGSATSAAGPVEFDASCVTLLRSAGAVPIGKTTTTEYAHVTAGPTRNPADLRHTPGGSSSGSAAAVAAGMVPIALGTQTGGSMIRPAAYCGVVGFKPTFGVVARDGMKVTCESLDVIGWFGANVPDVAAVGRVLLPGRRSPTSRQPHTLRVAFLAGNPGHVIGPDSNAALTSARRRLEAQGASVVQVEAFEPAVQMIEAHTVIMQYEFARSLLPVTRSAGHSLSGRLLEVVHKGLAVPAEVYVWMRSFQDIQRRRWDDYFGNVDLILTSSVLGAAPLGLEYTGDSAFNKGWSLLGWPCLHLPTTVNAKGLPLGVQLVARPGVDADLLAWGEVIHPLLDERSTLRAEARAE